MTLTPKISVLSILITALDLIPHAVAQPSTVAIHCSVVDDITRTPVSRARMTLSGGSLSKPVVAYTDGQGACPFSDLPAGRYKLAVDKAGYFPIDGSAGSNPSLDVDGSASAEVELGSVTLVKVRTISGTVKWQDGEPAVEHVLVSAIPVARGNAKPRPPYSPPVLTNDRGEFHLEHLSPGRYVVCAYPLGFADNGGQKPRIALPIYYPGSPVANVNTAIDMRNMADVQSLAITLTETSGVSVSGNVKVSPDLPKGSSVMIGLVVGGTPTQAFMGVRTAAGESFVLHDVPPGAYSLLAVSTGKMSRRAFRKLNVGTSPITNFDVDLPEPSSIAGSVWLKPSPKPGGPADQKPPARVPVHRVVLAAESASMPFLQDLSRLTDTQGNFHLEGAVEGEAYFLRATPPAGMYIQRVSQGGRDIEGAPYPIATGGGAIEIQLGDDVAKVNGSVQRPDGLTAVGFVVIAPRNRRAEHLYRTAIPAKDGTFTVESVPPGDYDAFAFDRNDEDNYFSDEYLHAFDSQAERFTVLSGQSGLVTLKMIDTHKN